MLKINTHRPVFKKRPTLQKKRVPKYNKIPVKLSDNLITLTIEEQSNILDDIIMYEPIDAVTLDKLINSNLLLTTYKTKMSSTFFENEMSQLIKYRTRMFNGLVSIKYTRQKNNPYGRCNPIGGIGLFAFRKSVRHTLASDRYYDFDIKNAHPCILLQVCQKYKIPCERLYLYVTKRQEFFDLVVNSYGCTEEQAKNLFIIYLYGGSMNCWQYKNEIDISKVSMECKDTCGLLEIHDLTTFREELCRINSVILKNNPNLIKVVTELKNGQGKNDYSLEGTVCSFFLQEYEVRILEQMYNYCIDNQLIEDNRCVLAADGIMLEKHLVPDPDKLLKEFSTLIKRTIGFNLIFTRKDMQSGFAADILDNSLSYNRVFLVDTFYNIVPYNTKIDMTIMNKLKTNLQKLRDSDANDKRLESRIKKEIEEEDNKAKQSISIEQTRLQIKYFEDFHFKLMTPICYGRKYLKGYEMVKDMNNLYSNLNYGKFITSWVCNPSIRTFEDVDFAPFPAVIHKDTFNLFEGLDGEKLLYGYDNPIDMKQLGHNSCIFIKQFWYLCGKSNICLEYVLNYLAHIIQYAGDLPRVALVFKSKQGVGKNVAFEKFAEKLLAPKYLLSTANLDNIVGRFAQNNQKLMVIMDEAEGKDTFMKNNSIKAFITAPNIQFEKKGIDAVTIRNCARSLFFYNDGSGVKIEQTDRRFVAMECANDMRNNEAYFAALLKAYETPSMVRDFYLLLKHRDISKYNSTNDRPITQLYREIQTCTIPIEQKYFISQIENSEDKIPMIGKEMYRRFCTWCEMKSFKSLTELTFVKRMNDEAYSFIVKTRNMSNQFYQIDQEKLISFEAQSAVKYVEPVYDEYPSMYNTLI